MAVYLKEDGKLGAEEKMIAFNILQVIYLHDKRYSEALRDIRELLHDPEMRSHHEYLILKQKEVRQALARSLKKRRGSFWHKISGYFRSLTACRQEHSMLWRSSRGSQF